MSSKVEVKKKKSMFRFKKVETPYYRFGSDLSIVQIADAIPRYHILTNEEALKVVFLWCRALQRKFRIARIIYKRYLDELIDTYEKLVNKEEKDEEKINRLRKKIDEYTKLVRNCELIYKSILGARRCLEGALEYFASSLKES